MTVESVKFANAICKNIKIREEEVQVMVDQKGDLIYLEKPEEDEDQHDHTHTAGALAPRLNKSKNLLSPVEEEPSNAESLYNESESSSSDIFAEKEDKYTIVIVTTPVLESGEHYALQRDRT